MAEGRPSCHVDPSMHLVEVASMDEVVAGRLA